MTTINNLSRSATVADDDLIPVWDATEQDTRAKSVGTFASFIIGQLSGNWRIDTFAGDNVTTVFTLSAETSGTSSVTVTVDGFTLIPDTDYSVSGTTLTFAFAPPSSPDGSPNITVRHHGIEYAGTPAQAAFDATYAYSPATIGDALTGAPVDPHEYPWLAKGDGITDDGPAIAAALTFAASSGRRIVQLRGKTYRVTSTLALSSSGLQLRGTAPNQTILLIDQTTGPGVSLTSTYCGLSNLTVKASTTRANYTTGATYALAAGLFGVQLAAPADGGYVTAARIDRVVVQDHPNNGFYTGGYAVDSKFINCAAYANRGHGFFFDDRTLIGGLTNNRCGQIALDTCRALDNGGQAIHMDCSTGPTYRFVINNFETLWNAWNTSIAGLANAEIQLGGENHVFIACAQSPGPNGHTRTTTDTGRPRLTAPTPAFGIYIGSNVGSITLIENRFIRTKRGVSTAGTVGSLHLRVLGAYFTQQEPSGVPTNQDHGFYIGTGYKDLDIRVNANQPVNVMVSSPDTRGTVRIGDVESRIYGNNVGSNMRLTPGYQNATIASQSVNAQSVNVNLQTGAATNLVAIVFAGGSNLLPAGEVLHFYNGSAYTITLKHGTLAGYIRTKSGTDVVVPAGGRFSIVVDPSGNPWEL